MNKKIIALSLATICIVTVVALSLEVVSRQQQLQQENRDLEQSQQGLQNRLDALSKIDSKDEKLTDEPESATATPSAPAGLETYSSGKNQISFSYPSAFSREETTVATYSNGKSWNKILLSHESEGKKTTLLIEANPDGYGPIFADKNYTLVGNENGTLEIASEETAARTENNNDQRLIIVANMPTDINDQHYSFRLESESEDADTETILKDLIASVKISK